ncbi:MAG TPA: ABC transporter ATP-binding protein, partial [Candidatus Limnocylindria bacterium]|nr:ABC transporter ATP-binding protein [Candidatus Limnocylindria bacterium]
MVGLACAFVLTGLSLAIPVLIQHAIDDAILKHDREKLLVFLGAIMAIACARFAVNFTRRYATARVGINVEALMRQYMYSAYLRYPRAFYDRHATGEVVSRATNDLYPIRYFIGWGLIQGTQSLLMIVGASAVLVTVNATLMLYAAVVMPLVGLLAWFFAHKVFPISRRVQEKKAVVTEAADEAVVGIEMVQAFGREDDVRDRFGGRAELLRDETLRQAAIESRYIPGLLFIPTLGIAAVVYFGGKEVIAGTLTLGEFTLFMQLLLMLVWPLEALGWIINLGQRALASASRSFAWLDSIEPLPEPSSPRPLPAGKLAVE